MRAAAEQAEPGQLGARSASGPTAGGAVADWPTTASSPAADAWPIGGLASGAGGYDPAGAGPGNYGPGGSYPSWPSGYGPPRPAASGIGVMEVSAVILLLVGAALAAERQAARNAHLARRPGRRIRILGRSVLWRER